MTQHPPVSAELELRLVVPGRPSLPVLAELRYDADDPWAVRVVFRTGDDGDGDIAWLFARSLLTEGLSGAVGEGDVRVWPGRHGRSRVLHLAMESPSGAALFEMAREDVVAFLARTYTAVATGAEPEVVDLDAELSLLLTDRR